MCKACSTFNVNGITFCIRCQKLMDQDASTSIWTALSIKEKIDFTNATLKALVWKENKTLRGGRSIHPEKQKRDHARELYKRARKGAKQIDGTTANFGRISRPLRSRRTVSLSHEDRKHPVTRGHDGIRSDCSTADRKIPHELSRSQRPTRGRTMETRTGGSRRRQRQYTNKGISVL